MLCALPALGCAVLILILPLYSSGPRFSFDPRCIVSGVEDTIWGKRL